MLLMIQESEQREEEEEVVRRREVGCQWESPEEERREVGCQWESPEEERREVGCQWESPEEERGSLDRQWESAGSLDRQWESAGSLDRQWESAGEERREVGCQSDSAERRDATVQVDLLTQRISWRLTGEPGGGALLQHCSLQRTPSGPVLYLLCPPYTPTLLPSMPLCAMSPTTGWQREASPPADMSAPPPGLIAPLSPRLAEEEEEEEEEEDSVKHDNVTVTGRHLLMFKPTKCTTKRPGSSAHRRKMGMKADEEELLQPGGCQDIDQSEERETPSIQQEGRHKSRDKTGRIQHTREDSKEKEEKKEEEAGRLRRKTVGPPIRYLVESEEQSHGLSAANPSRAKGVKMNRPIKRLRKDQEEEGEKKKKKEEEKKEEEEEKNEKKKEEDEEEEEEKKEEEEEKKKEEEEEEKKKEEEEEQEKKEEEEEKKKEEAGRPRRNTVGPPIRYLLESEEQSHDLSIANHSRAKGVKMERPIGKLKKDPQEEEEEKEEQEEDEEEEEKKKEEAGRPRRNTVGPPIRYLVESEEQSHDLLAANHSKAKGVSRKRLNGRLTKDHQEEEEEKEEKKKKEEDEEKEKKKEEKKKEEEEKKKDEAGRPRRNTVGPPIRYLVESEEQSHDLSAANHSRVKGVKMKRPIIRKDHQEEEEEKEEKKKEEEEEEEKEEGEEKRKEEDEDERRCEEQERKDKLMVREDGGVNIKPLKTKKEEMQQAGRPRRNTVGPPIRYLVESEEQSHDLSAANHSRAKGVNRKRRLKKEEGEEEEKEDEDEEEEEFRIWTDAREELQRTASSREASTEDVEMDRWWQLCQVCGLIVACKKSHNELNHGNTLHRHRHHHHSNTGSCHSNRAEAGGARAAVVKQQQEVDARTDGGTSEGEDEEEEEETPATKWYQEKDGGRKRKREEEEEVKLIRVKEEDGGEEEDVKKEVTEQPQRPRRRMVGPPIRYLLESEEQSHGLGVKHARKSEAGGGASEDMSVIDRSEDAGQTGWTNQDTVNKPKKQGRGCLKKAVGVSRHLQSGQLTLISPCCVRLQRLL